MHACMYVYIKGTCTAFPRHFSPRVVEQSLCVIRASLSMSGFQQWWGQQGEDQWLREDTYPQGWKQWSEKQWWEHCGDDRWTRMAASPQGWQQWGEQQWADEGKPASIRMDPVGRKSLVDKGNSSRQRVEA